MIALMEFEDGRVPCNRLPALLAALWFSLKQDTWQRVSEGSVPDRNRRKSMGVERMLHDILRMASCSFEFSCRP